MTPIFKTTRGWRGGGPPMRNKSVNWMSTLTQLEMLRKRFGYDWIKLQHNDPRRITASYAAKQMRISVDEVQTHSRLCGPYQYGHPTKSTSIQSGRIRGGRKTDPQKNQRAMGWETWIRLTPPETLSPAQIERIEARDAHEAELEKRAPRTLPITPEQAAAYWEEQEFKALTLTQQKKARKAQELEARKKAWQEKWDAIEQAEAEKKKAEAEWDERVKRAIEIHRERKARAPMVQKYKYN